MFIQWQRCVRLCRLFVPPPFTAGCCWMLAAGADEEDAFGRFRDGLRGSNPIERLDSLLYSRSSSLSDARNNNQVNSGDPPLCCCFCCACAALSSSQSIIEDSSKNWNWITLALNAASRITFEPPFRSRASTTSPRTGQHCFSSCAPAAAAAKGKLSIG